jgi:hypothetical protein
MGHRFAEIAFTPTVRHVQEELGSRSSYARMEAGEAMRNHVLGPSEAGFIAEPSRTVSVENRSGDCSPRSRPMAGDHVHRGRRTLIPAMGVLWFLDHLA